MRSTFRRGIELLSEQESDTSQSQEQTAKNVESASENIEGVCGGVPRNVTQLKPVINELMRKMVMIAI